MGAFGKTKNSHRSKTDKIYGGVAYSRNVNVNGLIKIQPYGDDFYFIKNNE